MHIYDVISADSYKKRKNIMKSLICLTFALLIGCSTLQNLTVDDVRQDRFLAVDRSYDLTIKQITQNMYQYDTKCSPLPGTIRIDPSNPNNGLLTVKSMGFTDVSIVAVVDFKQDGTKTLVKGYKYTTPLISPLDSIIWAIDNPSMCYSDRPAINK